METVNSSNVFGKIIVSGNLKEIQLSSVRYLNSKVSQYHVCYVDVSHNINNNLGLFKGFTILLIV